MCLGIRPLLPLDYLLTFFAFYGTISCFRRQRQFRWALPALREHKQQEDRRFVRRWERTCRRASEGGLSNRILIATPQIRNAPKSFKINKTTRSNRNKIGGSDIRLKRRKNEEEGRTAIQENGPPGNANLPIGGGQNATSGVRPRAQLGVELRRLIKRTAMHRFPSFILTLLLAAAAVAAAAQERGILPQTFGGWNASAAGASAGNASADASSSPASAVSVPQAILNEYGWLATEPKTYSTGCSCTGNMRVAVFRMKDPSGAYGLYTYMRTADMARADFGEHSAISRQEALALFGNLVLDVRGQDLRKKARDISALAKAVSTHAEQGPLPRLWQNLPAKNMVARSDHYVLGPQALDHFLLSGGLPGAPGGLGNSLGFSNGAEAELARYRLQGREATLLIADYPTPQIAEQSLASLEKQFNVNGAGGNSAPFYAKRSDTLLAIVSGAATRADADSLLAQVKSETVLTWNEPTFQFKEPSIYIMIAEGLIGTVAICFLSLLAGVGFGGFRVVTKRLFPNKVFDKSSNLEVLQLGLSSKPINAEDFYALGGPKVKAGHVDKNLPDRIALRIFR